MARDMTEPKALLWAFQLKKEYKFLLERIKDLEADSKNQHTALEKTLTDLKKTTTTKGPETDKKIRALEKGHADLHQSIANLAQERVTRRLADEAQQAAFLKTLGDLQQRLDDKARRDAQGTDTIRKAIEELRQDRGTQRRTDDVTRALIDGLHVDKLAQRIEVLEESLASVLGSFSALNATPMKMTPAVRRAIEKMPVTERKPLQSPPVFETTALDEAPMATRTDGNANVFAMPESPVLVSKPQSKSRTQRRSNRIAEKSLLEEGETTMMHDSTIVQGKPSTVKPTTQAKRASTVTKSKSMAKVRKSPAQKKPAIILRRTIPQEPTQETIDPLDGTVMSPLKVTDRKLNGIASPTEGRSKHPRTDLTTTTFHDKTDPDIRIDPHDPSRVIKRRRIPQN